MDIVESLRKNAKSGNCQNPLAQMEAADEIERMRKFVINIEARLVSLDKRVSRLEK